MLADKTLLSNWLVDKLYLSCSLCSLMVLFQDAQYGQGYAQQGGPTSFSNQMWTDRKQVGQTEVHVGINSNHVS